MASPAGLPLNPMALVICCRGAISLQGKRKPVSAGPTARTRASRLLWPIDTETQSLFLCSGSCGLWRAIAADPAQVRVRAEDTHGLAQPLAALAAIITHSTPAAGSGAPSPFARRVEARVADSLGVTVTVTLGRGARVRVPPWRRVGPKGSADWSRLAARFASSCPASVEDGAAHRGE